MADNTTTARIKLALEGASVVQQGLNKVETSVASAGKAMLGLAGGLSVAGFASWVKGAINAADETSKLAQKTGLAVNQVAGLQLAFRQSGASAEQFVPIMAKLGIAVTNGNKALDAMGVSSRNADGSLKGTRQVLGEVADKFKGYEDGAAKTALAVGLLGEEGAKLLPFLNQGADGLAAYDDMAQRLGLTLDTKTAKAAEQFNDTIDLMGQSTQGVARQVAAQLLPTLNTLAGEFFRTLTQGDALNTTVTVLSGAMRGLYAIGVGVVEAFKTVGTALGGVGAAIAAVMSGDFGQVRGILSDMSADISASWLASGASISRAWANAGDTTVAALSASAAAAREGAPAIAAAAKATNAKADADKKAAAALRERIAAAQSNNTAFDEEFKRIEDTRLAIEGRIKSGREMLEAIERETALLGLGNTEREQAIALFELERSGVVKGTEAYNAYAAAIAAAIGTKNTRQATLDAQKKAADDQLKAIEDQQEAYADMWRSVDQTAHDVFVNVADEGMDAFKRIGKTLKAAILDMLYQMTVKKWIFQISGQTGGGSVSSTGSLVDYASSAYSAYSAAAAGGAGTAGASGSMAAVGSYAGGSMSGANAAGSIYANTTGTGMNGLLATNGAYGTAGSAGASSGAGAAMGWMGWAALIAAAVMIAKNLYEKGYTRAAVGYGKEQEVKYGQYTTYTADNSMGKSFAYDTSFERFKSNMLEGLGMSEKWVDILSGTTRMATLFGRKLGAYGFNADIAGGESEVSGFARYKGGLFRSNKTVGAEVDPRDAAAFDAQVESVIEGSRAMARAMGLNEAAIDSYTGSIKVNFKGATTAQEQSERLGKAMEDLQYSLLNAAGGGRMAREEFERMQTAALEAAGAAGISAQSISDVLMNGMVQGLGGEQTGAQLADVIVGGIYRSIAQQYTQQIAQMFMGQIVTPIFTAMAAGVPISQAISAAAIDNMVANAQQAAEALNAIFSNAEFQAAMGLVGDAIASAAGSFGGIEIPNFAVEYNAAADEARRVADERLGIESELLQLLGETARLRERELLALDASNRALKQQVWLLEDAREGVDAALEALSRAADAERDRLSDALDLARDVESDLADVFGTLRDNIRELRDEVVSTAALSAEQGRRNIAAMLAGTASITPESVSDAVRAVRDGVDAARYTSAVDRDRARLLAANEFAALQALVEPRLSTAEQTVVMLETQVAQLEDQTKLAEQQVNALFGIEDGVLSMAEALADLAGAMQNYSGVREASRFASGGAFTNGVVRRPTYFDMGQMGEKTPEAIMPLANINGALGVRVIGGGSDAETKALLRELITRVRAVEGATTAVAVNSANTDRRLKNVIRAEDGNERVMVGTPGLKPLPVKETAS